MAVSGSRYLPIHLRMRVSTKAAIGGFVGRCMSRVVFFDLLVSIIRFLAPHSCVTFVQSSLPTSIFISHLHGCGEGSEGYASLHISSNADRTTYCTSRLWCDPVRSLHSQRMAFVGGDSPHSTFYSGKAGLWKYRMPATGK